jgi:hypothetical protein
MQHDSQPSITLSSATASVAGIDWATDANALCIIDGGGQILSRVLAPADAAGIGRLVDEL